jgi:intracellular multiplication protein IcmL
MTAAPSQPPASQRPSLKKMWADEGVLDEKIATSHFNRLRTVVTVQVWIMAGLSLALMVILPFAQPFYHYYARTPDEKLTEMVGLNMPNMTNRAILAWSTTSITEIMTMGFGDLDVKVPKQKWRFTKKGWEAYVKAFVGQGIGEAFKQSQLVLTTVPSNTPVIIYQGLNEEGIYQWVVQMPVIMTYATNNNVTRRKSSVATLTIVRVPPEESTSGVAIEDWISH